MKKKVKVADLFCGAGGSTHGAREAFERLDMEASFTAINHWPIAVETHTKNHPAARHLCTAVNDVDPRKLYRRGELFLLWASPECTNHSRARGGMPIFDQSRATAHCVVRWAEALLPPIILVENVPEFQQWGPIGSNGRPLKSGKGWIFQAWIAMLKSLGYKVEFRVLCAANYGDPTTRERLFIQCVRGHRRITWPDRTHAPAQEIAALDGRKTKLRSWVPARDIIDWKLRGRFLDEMPPKRQYGGLPLSPKTLNRIHVGFKRFGLKPFIVPAQSGQNRVRSIERPLQTVTTESRGIGLLQPFLISIDHVGGNGNGGRSIESPLSSVTSKARHGIVEPFIVDLRGTTPSALKGTARSIDRPLSTVSAGGRHHGLVEPFLVQVAHGESGGCRARSIDRPLPTVCGARGDMALIEAHLLPQHGGGKLRPVSSPVPTVATAGAIALVEPYLVKFYGTAGAASVNAPLDTVTTKDRFALVNPVVTIDRKRYRVRFRWRMLQLHELQLAQGFPKEYEFSGNKTEGVKQVGNAVPGRLSRALVLSAVTQRSDISWADEPPGKPTTKKQRK